MHILMALAFVPVNDVLRAFNLVTHEVSVSLAPIILYLEEFYVIRRLHRGERTEVPPLYPPQLWNHYQSVIDGEHKTNNDSAG